MLYWLKKKHKKPKHTRLQNFEQEISRHFDSKQINGGLNPMERNGIHLY